MEIIYIILASFIGWFIGYFNADVKYFISIKLKSWKSHKHKKELEKRGWTEIQPGVWENTEMEKGLQVEVYDQIPVIWEEEE